MPKPRSAQISLETTSYYHCNSRCVRRAFLCGQDLDTGIDYEYRRERIEQRILQLAGIFCLDVCAYAVMSNHYHVILHVNQNQALSLTTEEIHTRWQKLFNGNLLSSRYLRGDALCDAELQVITELAEKWRERLMDISWFMRVLNEGIAREANREDQCTGRFWEPDADQSIKSQALLDEQALAACMAYVDLNPIRAQLADTPETSDHTSAKQRIKQAKQTEKTADIPNQPKALYPFVGNPREPMPEGLPFKLKDYLELLDWTGRTIREDKRGSIPANTPPILQRLNISPKNWLYSSQYFERSFSGFVGKLNSLREKLPSLGYQRIPQTGLLLT